MNDALVQEIVDKVTAAMSSELYLWGIPASLFGVLAGGFISTLTSFIVNFLNGRHQRKLEKIKFENDKQRVYVDRKIDVYIEVMAIMSILVPATEVTATPQQRDNAFLKARDLDNYIGEVNLFLSPEMSRHMATINNLSEHFQKNADKINREAKLAMKQMKLETRPKANS